MCYCFSTCNRNDTHAFLQYMPSLVFAKSPWSMYLKHIYGEVNLPFSLDTLEFFYHNDLGTYEWPMASCMRRSWARPSRATRRQSTTWIVNSSAVKCSKNLCDTWFSKHLRNVSNFNIIVFNDKGKSYGSYVFKNDFWKNSHTSNEWVEVFRTNTRYLTLPRYYSKPEGYGMGVWFYKTRGSGIFLNLGNTFVLDWKLNEKAFSRNMSTISYKNSIDFIQKNKLPEHIPVLANKLNFTSVQIMKTKMAHNSELVLTSEKCMYNQSVVKACPFCTTLYFKKQPCQCDDTRPVLNCFTHFEKGNHLF